MKKKKFINIIVFLSSVFCLQACDVIYSYLQKEGAEEKKIIGEIEPFEKSPKIEEAQNLLRLYGYNPGKVDGKLGPKTREAIGNFQKDSGLNPSRFLDQETWVRLVVIREKGLIKGEELNVKLIQEILAFDGFNPGLADGHMGAKTMEAVIKFQKKYQLKADGKIGYQTLSKLAEFVSMQD